MGDSESSLFSFFFYVLFVYPATNWLLKPGRFSRTKGLTYAISLLVAIAAVKTGLELKEQGPNYYQLLKVGRGSTALEIKRSYKKMSLELHPDKNPSATALDDFATLKNAYDVLMDMDAREVYDRFGPEKLKQKVAVIDEYKVLVEVAIFYAAWGIMTWMLTLGKHNANARQWVFTGSMQCLFGDGVGGVRGDSDHRPPASAASVEVDAVEAGATHGDETNAEVREGVDGVGVGDVVDEEADGVGAGGQGGGVGAQGHVQAFDVAGEGRLERGDLRGVHVRGGGEDSEVDGLHGGVQGARGGDGGGGGGGGGGWGRCRRRARGEGIARRTEIDILTRRVESRTRHAAARGRVEARRAKRKSEWRLTSSQHGRCAVREVRARRWPEADARLTIM